MLPQDLGAKSLQMELIISKKREILPLENEAVFHGEHHKALLPNTRSVNDLGEPSAQEYNCQFAGISPAIRQNKNTHQRKSFARCSHASLTHLISTHHCSAGMRIDAPGTEEPGDSSGKMKKSSPVPDKEVIVIVR